MTSKVEIKTIAHEIQAVELDSRSSELTGSFARPLGLARVALAHGLNVNEEARDAALAAAYPFADTDPKGVKATMRTKRSTAALVMKYAAKAEAIERVCQIVVKDYGLRGTSGGELFYRVTRKLKDTGAMPKPEEFKPADKKDATRAEEIAGLVARGERLLRDAKKAHVLLHFNNETCTAEDVKPAEVTPPPTTTPAPTPAPTAPANDPMVAMMAMMSQLAAEVAALKAK